VDCYVSTPFLHKKMNEFNFQLAVQGSEISHMNVSNTFEKLAFNFIVFRFQL
jgi:hypothetical protein